MKHLTYAATAALTALALTGCDLEGLNQGLLGPTPPPSNAEAATVPTNDGDLERLLDVQIRLERKTNQRGLSTTDIRLDPILLSRAKHHARTEVTGAADMLVIGKDAENREVYREIVQDPLEFEAEIFDATTGAIALKEPVERESALLRLRIPARLKVNQLEIYRVSESLEPTLLQEVAIDQPPTSTQPTARSQTLSANGVHSIKNNGDSANRVDLVILSEGYTQNELPQFEQDARVIMEGYFDEAVYTEYEPLFNVWRVEVASNQSGAGQGAPKDTRFGAHFGCYNIQRLLCVDEAEVFDYLRSVLPSNAIDKVLVVVNTETYGGAGGQVATMSLAPQAIDLALHELGHSFAKLADEYDYGTCRRTEPSNANATTDPNGGKWSHWFDRASNVGVYEGAMYCPSGMYRPTYTSMMKDLGQPFYAVNESQIVRSIYQYVSVMDGFAPSAASIAMAADEVKTFSVTPVQNQSGTTGVTWYLNNQPVADGAGYDFAGPEHASGTYQLKAVIHDNTGRVIKDPDNLLTSSRTWTIELGGSGQSCDKAPTVPTGLNASELQSNPFRLSWQASLGAQSYVVQQWTGYEWAFLEETSETSIHPSSGPVGNTDYFRLYARNACGNSAATAWISVQYPACTAVPEAPTGLQAQSVQSTQYTLAWWPVDNTDEYRVEVWNGYEGSWDERVTTGDSWAYIRNLNPGTVQYVRVVAGNSCGESEATAYIRVQTPY